MARIPKLDSAGKFLAADVNAQIDARTKATMRADLPALAKELKIGGSGSGIEEVSGTVTLDATGPAIREFWSTGATTFKANGADTLISSATGTVWRRTGSGSWGYQVVPEEWTTPTTTPDTTAPVAGTLAVSITGTTAALNVSGATDNKGVTGYSFSKDNGATWSSWQASESYSYTGLNVSTAYTFRHRVQDAAGNISMGTAVSKTTAAAPSNSAPTANLTVSAMNLRATATWTTSDADNDAVTAKMLDWGDGTTPVSNPSSGATHEYVGAGTWTVSLTVSDGKASTTVTKTVTTSNPVDVYPSATIYDTFTAPDGTRIYNYVVATGESTQRVTEKGGLKWGRYANVSLWPSPPSSEVSPTGATTYGPSISGGRTEPGKYGMQLQTAQPKVKVEVDYNCSGGSFEVLLSGSAGKGIHIRNFSAEGLKIFEDGAAQRGSTAVGFPTSGTLTASYDPATGAVSVANGDTTVTAQAAPGRTGTVVGFYAPSGSPTFDNVRVTYL